MVAKLGYLWYGIKTGIKVEKTQRNQFFIKRVMVASSLFNLGFAKMFANG